MIGLAEQLEGRMERWEWVGTGWEEKRKAAGPGALQSIGGPQEPEDCHFKHGRPGLMKVYLSG